MYLLCRAQVLNEPTERSDVGALLRRAQLLIRSAHQHFSRFQNYYVVRHRQVLSLMGHEDTCLATEEPFRADDLCEEVLSDMRINGRERVVEEVDFSA
eukprot:scaffold222399_cov29-Tisochrysis_lutea.AAC.4